MKITDNLKISDIKEAFHKTFPGLKLEFYKKAHSMEEGSKLADQYEDHMEIGDIRSIHESGDIVIDPEMSVGALEQAFEAQMGLHVQVFRKSNALWLQTSSTDHWTLKEQNRKGIASTQAS